MADVNYFKNLDYINQIKNQRLKRRTIFESKETIKKAVYSINEALFMLK